MPKFAVIKTGGKQYLVTPGMKLKIEKVPNLPSSGGKLVFDEVLAVGDENGLEAGKNVSGAKVEAEWQREGKGKKIIVARYHSKTRYRRKKGHRQPFTEVLIKDIVK
ncbi:50S ribosomal protein L21 [Candidatus Giovannonibacteria bacterium]|nr:50S ribosomal protein L21 [Candidatus Giovannonibacteria bacterium]